MADVTVSANIDSFLQAATAAAANTVLALGTGDSPTWTAATLSTGPLTINGAVLARDANNVLAVRNAANACKARVYYSYTDGSNYQGMEFTTGAAVCTWAAYTAGTGEDNIDLALTPSGTGTLKFGTHSAVGAETVTGYITIKDAAGNSRKLAVIS